MTHTWAGMTVDVAKKLEQSAFLLASNLAGAVPVTARA
jgi:hypothetical protein